MRQAPSSSLLAGGIGPSLRVAGGLSGTNAGTGPPFGLTCLIVRIGILGGPGLSAGAPLDGAVQRLGTELARRCWGMVLGVPGSVAFDAIESGVDVVEVLARGAEPGTKATDLRAVDGRTARLEFDKAVTDAEGARVELVRLVKRAHAGPVSSPG